MTLPRHEKGTRSRGVPPTGPVCSCKNEKQSAHGQRRNMLSRLQLWLCLLLTMHTDILPLN